MTRQFNRILRWLLFLWVRVEVFPDDDPQQAFDPARPTLYVLADRGLADLLVLTQVTRRYGLPDPRDRIPINALRRHPSVYSIASRSPMTDWIRRRRKHSVMLTDLMQAFAEDQRIDLQVVPVSLFWGRPLERQKGWLQVLFADTWSLAGRTRKFFKVLIHGRNARLIFSDALKFRDIIDSCGQDENDVQEFLISTLRRQHAATFGPQIISHRHLSAKVVEDSVVQELITESTDTSLRRYARAHRYCREIFADCTQLTIEVMLRLLRAFWNRFYSGIEIYHAERLRQAALHYQLVYVPCHRSHVDYLLLSYVIYNQNLAIPYIAAGDNLNIPFIGRILRGGGAFFIRRSFKENQLYSAVMRAYLRQLVKLGVPLEYFIEGGRSRTGRMLKPKIGMLGMTVEAYVKEQARPLAFMPVYIGYEKLVERKSYLGELYGGKKKRESTLGALRAIFRLKGHYGKVTASFGEPIELERVLDAHCADWRERAGEIDARPDWYRDTLLDLARQIMYGINRACVINPVNSIATILLATPRQSIEIEELIGQDRLHRRLIKHAPCLYSIRIEGKVNEKRIRHLARQKIIRIHEHEFGDIVYLEPEDTVLIGYYRNNSLHCLVLPALIACCFTNVRRASRAGVQRRIVLLYPFLKSELQLEWEPEDLEPIIEQWIASMIHEQLLEAVDEDLRRPQRSDHRFMQLLRLSDIVQPILERYYMTFIVLWQSSSAPLREDELEHRCHLLAQRISMIHGINSPDFFDRLLFRDFIETMLANGYLVKNDRGQLLFAQDYNYVSIDLRNLLSTQVRSSILSLVQTAPLPANSDDD